MSRSMICVMVLLAACGGGVADDGKATSPPVNPLAGGAQGTPPTNPLAGGGGSDVPQQPANPLGGPATQPVQSPTAAPTGPATAIVIGQTYSGAKQLLVPTVGLHFTIPSGWQAQAPGTVPLMVVTDGSAPEVLTLIWAQRPADLSTVQTLLSDPLELGPGASLRFGPVQTSGASISASVQSANGSTGRVEGLVSQGAAVLVLTVGPAGKENAGDVIRRTLLQSMKLGAATSGELASQVPQLRSMLAGTRLQRISSENFDSGFISSQSMWDFCGDGSFQYTESTTTSISGTVATDTGSSTDELQPLSGGGPSSSDRLQGRWQLDAVGSIAGEYLQISLQDSNTGRVQFMPILPTDTGVDFAGLSWSAVTSPLCQ